MNDYDKTTRFTGVANQVASSLVTIFDGNSAPRTIRLDEFGKNFIYFGRDPKNDIVLTSHLVSSEHGRFIYKGDSWGIEDKAAYKDTGSTNGLIYNMLRSFPVPSVTVISFVLTMAWRLFPKVYCSCSLLLTRITSGIQCHFPGSRS